MAMFASLNMSKWFLRGYTAEKEGDTKHREFNNLSTFETFVVDLIDQSLAPQSFLSVHVINFIRAGN